MAALNDTTNLRSLVSTLSASLADLSAHLDTLPDPDSPSSSSPEFAKLSSSILGLTASLQQRLRSPHSFLRSWVGGHYSLFALSTILEFGVLDKIALDGEETLEELSKHAAFDSDKLGRLMRLLCTNYVLEEPKPGVFRHTAVSAALVKDRALNSLAAMQLDEAVKAAADLPNYLRDSPYATQSIESPFKHRWGQPAFEFYGSKPEKAKRFALAMQGLSQMDRGHAIYRDWLQRNATKDDQRNTIVDVGGGNGHVSIAMAQEFPNLSFVVQDVQPAMFQQSMATLPESLKGRIAFEAKSFFTPQEPTGQIRGFFIRQCLHNWSDADSIQILRQFIEPMKQDASISLLINDSIMPEHGEVPLELERLYREDDVAMMVMVNAKQRTEKEWAELLAQADVGFKITSIVKDKASELGTMGLIEVKYTC